MTTASSTAVRRDSLVVQQAQRQIQTFFDELKNGTRNYRTVASLGGQIAQEYRGRCILELLQNAHDALAKASPDDPRRISFVLRTSPEPVLLIANSGGPFLAEDFAGICQLGQSPKDPNESIGNKGLGFRSVLEVCSSPEVWSTAPAGGDTSFVFRFDPAVSDLVADAARELKGHGLAARSPFDPDRALLDWSQEQLDQYRERLSSTGLDAAHEARAFLSPYLVPLPIEAAEPEVERLLHAEHVTVVRLRLDGGRTGDSADAVQSVRDQLNGLDARCTVFLPHLETLVIEVDGARRTLERVVELDEEFSIGGHTRQQLLLVGRSGPEPGEHTTRQFRLWTRGIGGDDEPQQAERIRGAVEHLPNRWPEVCRVLLGVAVEEAPAAEDGVFVIFLPTEMKTGTGAHINAPFYGSLDRRQINFDDPYNKLLLEGVLDLCLDVALALAGGQPEKWKARAIVDLLASIGPVSGKAWRISDRLIDRANSQKRGLDQQALVLCDHGWRSAPVSRVMPEVSAESHLSPETWRTYARFEIVAEALADRHNAVEQLLHACNGSVNPTQSEWRATLEHLAAHVQTGDVETGWDAFLSSVVAILPPSLRSAPRTGKADPLQGARFLPTQDGRLLGPSASAKLFFQPVRGADDAAEFVGDVPASLQSRVAFLHPDVRTLDGPKRKNTLVQKFLDERFARGFRREDLLRDVVVAALPRLPVRHDTKQAHLCAELFSWSMKLVGTGEQETLLPLLRRLPVACHGGWYRMDQAVFGPGWEDGLGDILWVLANDLPSGASVRIRETALLPPTDERWGTPVADKGVLLRSAGVVDGLRLQRAPEVTFQMEGHGRHELPGVPVGGTPKACWDSWRRAVHSEATPHYGGWFTYALSDIWLLPELHHLKALTRDGRESLWRLVIASLGHWPKAWHQSQLSKAHGNSWSHQLPSPLWHWLSTTAWLCDSSDIEQPLAKRWLVPESLLLGQSDRFGHLDPLSLELARRLQVEPELKEALRSLGLNLYPVEDHSVGPGLLDALAVSWRSRRVPARRFDVFLGQLRDAWRHLDTNGGLPREFVVRTGRRSFAVQDGKALGDVYLPDNRARTRSLRDHGKHVLEMQVADANRMATALVHTTAVRRASSLDERVLVDGVLWQGELNGAPLEDTRYAWLPAVLLTVMAHGGARPSGTATKGWSEAADELRRAHVLKCETIDVQLVDSSEVVASSAPQAHWLDGGVLAVRRDTGLRHEEIAAASQAALGRQDLLKDLRLVLGALSGREEPTPQQIESALERAEIDAQSLADVRHLWAGEISLLVDRIRPILSLLDVSEDGLDAASTDLDHLAQWLAANVKTWHAQDLLSAARRCRDDRAMGLVAWRKLGEIAQLPAWNQALAVLGERYEPVENRNTAQQTAEHFEEALPCLRAVARYVALSSDEPSLFHEFEDLTRNFLVPDEWSNLWWEIPFDAVVAVLRSEYGQLAVAEEYFDCLAGATSVDKLRAALAERSIQVEPSPYEVAGHNREALNGTLASVNDLHRAWLEDLAAPTPEPTEMAAELDPISYLRPWTEDELVHLALELIGDDDFVAACAGCETVEEIRSILGVDELLVEERRKERQRRKQEEERKRRTFNVAGTPFEVGLESYGDLFERLNELVALEGPAASRGAYTALSKTQKRRGGRGRNSSVPIRTSHKRPSADMRELIGVVGEIHALRFLQVEFGKAVSRDSWVSEIRLKVLPPVPGEPDRVSDSLGYDFRFRSRKVLWHVEVKATAGDDTQFELGTSEIRAASQLVGSRTQKWCLLRVRNALSEKPLIEWLPNPFEDGFQDLFRLQKGGLRVSYTPRSGS